MSCAVCEVECEWCSPGHAERIAKTDGVLSEVAEERVRQHMTWGQQDWPDAPPETPVGLELRARAADVARRTCEIAFEKGTGTWMHLLNEEVFEAFAETDPAKLRAELIQVAALAVQQVEAIDRRKSDGG